jgi:hypothetical protein
LPAEGSKIDCVGFNYIKYLFNTEMMIKTYQMLVIAAIVLGCYLLYKKKTKLLYAVVIISIVVSGVVSNCYTYSEYYKNKVGSIEKKEDAFTINSYFHDTIPSGYIKDFPSLLVISDTKVSDGKLEVYLQNPNYYYCKMKDFDDFIKLHPGERFSYLTLYSFNNEFQDEDFTYPEYILSYEPVYLDEYEEVGLDLNKYFFYKRVKD